MKKILSILVMVSLLFMNISLCFAENDIIEKSDNDIMQIEKNNEFEVKYTNDIEEDNEVSSSTIANGICGDNLSWIIDDEGTLTISGTGDMYSYDPNGPEHAARWYYYADKINNVIVSEGVTSIGTRAFYGLENLNSIFISKSVTNIEYKSNGFRGCTNLTQFNVDDENEYYADIDGVLFNKDKTQIIKYPEGKEDSEFIIPDSVTKIEDYSFYNCNKLTNIVISENVSEIDTPCFCDCKNLNSIVIKSQNTIMLDGEDPHTATVLIDNRIFSNIGDSPVFYVYRNSTFDTYRRSIMPEEATIKLFDDIESDDISEFVCEKEYVIKASKFTYGHMGGKNTVEAEYACYDNTFFDVKGGRLVPETGGGEFSGVKSINLEKEDYINFTVPQGKVAVIKINGYNKLKTEGIQSITYDEYAVHRNLNFKELVVEIGYVNNDNVSIEVSSENTTDNDSVTETMTSTTETTTAYHKSSGGGGGTSGKIIYKKTITESTTEVTTETTTEKTTKSDNVSKQVRVPIGSSSIKIGDKEYAMDSTAYIQTSSNSTMVPLRFVSIATLSGEITGSDESSLVNWDSKTKTASITVNSGSETRVIEFTAGSNKMVINGTPITIENGVKAEIKDGRMYVPFRALGSALGIDVSWDSTTRTAIYTIK